MIGHPIRLRPVAERDQLRREFVATIGYVHEDGTPFAPCQLPVVDLHDDDKHVPARGR